MIKAIVPCRMCKHHGKHWHLHKKTCTKLRYLSADQSSQKRYRKWQDQGSIDRERSLCGKVRTDRWSMVTMRQVHRYPNNARGGTNFGPPFALTKSQRAYSRLQLWMKSPAAWCIIPSLTVGEVKSSVIRCGQRDTELFDMRKNVVFFNVKQSFSIFFSCFYQI